MMNRLLFVTMTLAMMFVAISCTDDDDYTQGVWMRRSDLDGVARGYASSFTIGNRGYLCSGLRGTNKAYLKDLWEYNIDGDYWTQCADMPEEAIGRHSAASFALNDKGYITTGAQKNETTNLADTWEYNPASNTWRQMDNFAGGERYGALGFSLGGYGYVGTGYNDNHLKDFYRFDPTAPSGEQWKIVNGFGGYKRYYGTSFVIDDVAYICCGQNNSTLVDDLWQFDGDQWKQLRDIANTNSDEDYDDDYAIARIGAVSFVIDGMGYVASGSRNGVMSDYWVYNPQLDLWSGDSDDDFTPMTDVHNVSSGASSRAYAVSFSTGTRGFVLTGASGGSYFDDVYELLPYEYEEVD